MRLHEFTDPKSYHLSTDGMEAIIKQMKRIWCDHGIDADDLMILRIMNEPEDVE